MSPTHTEREAPRTRYENPADTHEAYEDEDYPMPHRYADAHASGSDREISLGTGTILAIFFALTLVCSVFFGFGYTIGHKSTGPAALAATAQTHSLSDSFKSFKPAPGGPAPATSPTSEPANPEDTSPTKSRATVFVPTNSAKTIATVASTTTKKPFDPDAEIVTTASPTPAAKSAAVAPPKPDFRSTSADTAQINPPASPAATGTAIVQVAAVSHQEDADSLLAALKRKGYTVAVNRQPQDRLLHIQLGPYPSKKDAEAMRVRLLADGYNSILK